jgi:hypothetical protein
MMKNPYPEQESTHERQRGGNRPATGEKHDSKKARTIPEDRRFSKDVVRPPVKKERES